MSAWLKKYYIYCMQIHWMRLSNTRMYWIQCLHSTLFYTCQHLLDTGPAVFYSVMRWTFSQKLFSKGIRIFSTLQFSSHSCLRTGTLLMAEDHIWPCCLFVKDRFCSCTSSFQIHSHLATSSCGICSDTSSCLDLILQTNYTSVSVMCINVHFISILVL